MPFWPAGMRCRTIETARIHRAARPLGGRVVAHRETALAALFPSDRDSSPSALRRWRDNQPMTCNRFAARSACRRARGAGPWGQSEMFLIEVLLDSPMLRLENSPVRCACPRADVRVGSFASLQRAARLRRMSAMPSMATESVRRNEPTRSARRRRGRERKYRSRRADESIIDQGRLIVWPRPA